MPDTLALLFGSVRRLAPRILLGAVLVAALAVASSAPTLAEGGGITPTPEPYSEYLVMIADGVFQPGPHPDVPGCGMFGTCDGDYFQEQIMERSPAEIAEQEAEAKAWFAERFGIDVDDPANADRVEFSAFMLDPRWNYRVYTWSGRNVPSEGYEVRDGGWALMITDPDGYTLGGDFEGVRVEQNDMAAFGNYNILATNPAGKNEEAVVLHYRSGSFMEVNDIGNSYIDCQMSRDGFAHGDEGKAQGFMGMAFDGQGRLHVTAKNVVTFDK